MTVAAARWHGSTMPSTQAPAVIETRALTKVYPGNVTALDGLTVDVGARRHRAGRRERCGQIDPDKDPARPHPADQGPGQGARPRLRDQRRDDQDPDRLHAGARLPAARRDRHRVRHPPGPDVRAAADGGQGARGRVAAPRRAARGAVPPDRHVLHRHEAAGQAGPGAGRRPAAAAARRADQRPRPGRAHRHARAHRPDRRRSSASRSWSPRTCSARSSGSATSWSRSTAGGCCAPTRITSFTQASQVLAVEVEEGIAQLQAELAARGLAATAAQRVLLVPLGGDDTYDVVRDAVADLALPLCRLEQRRHQVEELFRDEEAADV